MTSRPEHLSGLPGRPVRDPDVEHALVAALVLRLADPRELAGRVQVEDFADPAAGLIFGTVMGAAAGGRPVEPSTLPSMLRAAGELRGDGYPIRPLLDWLPTVPVPAHPQAWAGLVVAGSLGRQVEAAGVRLQQASDGYRDLVRGAGRVLAVAAAQRATVHQALVRWEGLPGSWRHAVSTHLQAVPRLAEVPRPRPAASHEEQLLERELLAGLVAAPALLDEVRWLHPRDFADPGCAELYSVLRQLHLEGRPIDLVTLAAAVPTTARTASELEGRTESPSDLPSTSRIEPESAAAQVCRALEPHRASPQMVPWLARQQLEASLLRTADVTGRDLVAVAAAPALAGGRGGPVLRAALDRLDDFTDEGRRLDAAQRRAPTSDDRRTGPSLTRLHALEPIDEMARVIEQDGHGGPGGGHLDRTVG